MLLIDTMCIVREKFAYVHRLYQDQKLHTALMKRFKSKPLDIWSNSMKFQTHYQRRTKKKKPLELSVTVENESFETTGKPVNSSILLLDWNHRPNERFVHVWTTQILNPLYSINATTQMMTDTNPYNLTIYRFLPKNTYHKNIYMHQLFNNSNRTKVHASTDTLIP